MAKHLNFTTPTNEEERLSLIEKWDLEELIGDPFFEQIAIKAAHCCNAPMGLVTLITRESQCNLGRYGSDEARVPREFTFCGDVVRERKILIVEDTHKSPFYSSNPLVVADPSIRFYAGIPLIVDNRAAIGSLCVVDSQPRRLSIQARAVLMGLVHQVEERLNRFVLAKGGPALTEEPITLALKYKKRLAHKEDLGIHLLKKLRQHIGFLSGDLMFLDRERQKLKDTSELQNEIFWALERVDQLAENAQNILSEPSGKIQSKISISLSEAVERSKTIMMADSGHHFRDFNIRQKAEDDKVFGDHALLEELVTQAINLSLRASRPDTDILVVIDKRYDEVVLEIHTEGKLPTESIPNSLQELTEPSESPPYIPFSSENGGENTLRFASMIVEAHDGSITLQDAKPGQRCLHITLPAAS